MRGTPPYAPNIAIWAKDFGYTALTRGKHRPLRAVPLREAGRCPQRWVHLTFVSRRLPDLKNQAEAEKACEQLL